MLTIPIKRSKDAFANDWLACSSSFETCWPCCDFIFAFFKIKKMRPSTRASKESYAARYDFPSLLFQSISLRLANVFLMMSNF